MATKIYINAETSIVFADSAQSPDADITLSNLANGAGRVSDQYDLGSAARPALYHWQGVFQFKTAPTIGDSVDLYLAGAQATAATIDGGQGQSDAALGSSDELRNLLTIGQVVATSATADHDMIASGQVLIPFRYVSLVVFNDAGSVNLRDNTSVHSVTFTPIPYEAQ